MSTLEHIRKRPALVISILGLALVLFIITAVSDNIFSFFGDRDTVVKVDGEKLKYDKLHRSSSMIADQMRQAGREDLDASYSDETALQQIISEELMDKQLDKLGITVTDEEMEAYLFGPASIATREAQRYGFPSAEDFYSFAYSSNDAGTENARALWQDMENRIRRQVVNAKYRLQLGAITANKLDAKAYYDENKNVTLNLAKVDYVTLGNDDYKVTDEEIKDRYNAEKERYSLDTEVRLVDYIIVTPTPSPEDASAASDEVAKAVSRLKETAGTEAVAGIYDFETTVQSGSEASLPAYLRNALATLEADTVALLSFNGSAYNIAKLLSKETAVEKADVDFFITMNEILPIDSITAAVAAGDISQYGDSVQKVSKSNLRLINGELLADYADKFINAPEGANVVTDKEFKTQILNELFNGQIQSKDMDAIGVCYKVNSVDDPAAIYEIASITRELVPSEATISGKRQQLADYSAKNATAEAFRNNIANSDFHVEQGRVSPDRFAVIAQNGQRIPQTASLARWAMEDAKKGDVSDVTDAGDSFVVIAVSDIYADKYVPVTDPTVKEQITAELRAEKKGAKLVDDYKGKGKSVDEYAAAMNTHPITVRANYAQNDGGLLRGDSKFLAAVGAAEKGKLVGPVATDNAAVVFEIVEIDNAGGEFNFEQVAPVAASMFQFNLDLALRANKDIEYKALRFQARD